ncbi:MAG: choice-of-anchor D domain-containing protein [Bacteroidota bacterium]
MKKLFTIFTMILLVCGSMDALAQTNRFSNGTEGTEFWFLFPVAFPEQGGNNSLKIYVSCEIATQCTLEIPGYGTRQVKITKPNDVIDFTLYPGQGQPYESMGVPGTAKSENETYVNGKGKGIHIYADVPITVYGVSRYIYTSDSFIALPTSSLGTEYIVASYADMSGTMFQGYHLPSQAVIVAAHDSTTVSFTLGGSNGTETVGGMKRGETKTFKLNKGDIVAFANKKINGFKPDLSGSKITSDKPIAVMSGNQCANIAVDNQWCDFIMEMELPTQTWGKEYHVTRFIKRLNYAYIKVIAKEPNTKLYRNGDTTPFAVLTTAGGRQNTGYYEGRVMADGSSPRPIIIRGDKPISVTQFNPGQQEDNVSSDPFQLVLTPIEQYQKEITFNTPGIKGGQGFKENYVNLVFEANADSTMPDDLEFGKVENSQFTWKSVKSTFGATAEAFKRFAGDTKKYFAKIISLPGDGVYKFRALKPFAAYSYGFDSYDSYGHPTSLILNDVSAKDTLAPVIDLLSNVTIDSIKTNLQAQDTGLNQSKVSRIFLNPAKSNNYRIVADPYIPGDKSSVNFVAQVVDSSQDAKAEIVAVDRAGNHSVRSLVYKGRPVKSYSVNAIDFGLHPVNIQANKTLSIRNTGQVGITLYSYTSPTIPNFNLVNWPTFPLQIKPNEELQLGVAFWAPTAGTFKDSVLFTSDAGTFTVHLTAQTVQGVLSATSLDFGTNTVGKDTSGYITLTNTGNAPIHVVAIESPKNSAFSWPTVGNIDIQPSETYTLSVRFMSNIPGSFIDTMRIITNDGVIESIVKGIAESTTDIERVYDPSFNITPNPAAGFTTINLPSFKSQDPLLKVYDALGKEVADLTGKLKETGNSQLKYDISSLSNGVYFLRLTDGNKTFSRTLIVRN